MSSAVPSSSRRRISVFLATAMTLAMVVASNSPSRPAAAAEGQVSTFAGTPGASPTTATALDMGPLGLVWVPGGVSGTVYSVDGTFNVVRKFVLGDPTSTATIDVGNGARGNGGASSAATTAYDMSVVNGFDPPIPSDTPAGSITVDSQGNPIFSETGNNRIKRVVGGVVETLIGSSTGAAGTSADGLYTPGTPALLTHPDGVDDFGGKIYFTEAGNGCLRSYSPPITPGGAYQIATLAGICGQVGSDLLQPAGIVVDAAGDFIYVADSGNDRVVKVPSTGGTPELVIDGLNKPHAVALDPSGNLYVADTFNDRVLKLTGTSTPSAAVSFGGVSISRPRALSTSTTDLYVASFGTRRIVRNPLTDDAPAEVVSGDLRTSPRGDGGNAVEAQFNTPSAGVVRDGDYYIADTENNLVRRIRALDQKIFTAAGTLGDTTVTIPPEGSSSRVSAGSVRLSSPSALASNSLGDLFIANTGSNQVLRVARDGSIFRVAGDPGGVVGDSPDGTSAVSARLSAPMGVLEYGAVYISDTGNGDIKRVVNGVMSTFSTGYTQPRGLAVDVTGTVYVADTGSHVVYAVASDGTKTIFAGTLDSPGSTGDGAPADAAKLNEPTSVAVDKEGNVLIADRGNHKVRKVTRTSLNISTFAGAGQPEYGGDGQDRTNALVKFSYPQGVFLDCDGNVFVADTSSNRIRKIEGAAPSGPGGYWLDAFGGVHTFGSVPAVDQSERWPGWKIARGLVVLPDQSGGYVLDGWGGLHPFDTSTGRSQPPLPAVSGDYFPGNDIARAVVLDPSSTRANIKGYWMDSFGSLHPFNSQESISEPVSEYEGIPLGAPLAKDLVMLPDGTGGYILDGYGGLHRFAIGDNRPPKKFTLSHYWGGWDIARSLALRSDTAGGYILDGWGGVHTFSTGTAPQPPPALVSAKWVGWDIARGLTLPRDNLSTPEINESATGGFVLEGFGGLHPYSVAGVSPAVPCNTGYRQADDAVDVTQTR